MKAILTVIGKDHVGIIAAVSQTLAAEKINILDVSQTLMGDNFVMMMLVQVPKKKDLQKLNQEFAELSKKLKLEINLRNEELYSRMHNL